tara:strand:+ start:1220 stop:1474 length:255 start_codon:yes stop_codon:yes gene_type:complete
MELFWNLPIELRSKIMFSGWIRHPTADIITNFLLNIMPMEYDTRLPPPSFIRHLTNTGELNETDIMVHLEIDEFLQYVVEMHMD